MRPWSSRYSRILTHLPTARLVENLDSPALVGGIRLDVTAAVAYHFSRHQVYCLPVSALGHETIVHPTGPLHKSLPPRGYTCGKDKAPPDGRGLAGDLCL